MAIREGSWLGTPAVNIGNRQADRDRGRNVVDVSYDREAILTAIRSQSARGRLPSDPVYGRGDAGGRIAEVLAKAQLSIETGSPKIGRDHVCTPVTNALLVCTLLLAKKHHVT